MNTFQYISTNHRKMKAVVCVCVCACFSETTDVHFLSCRYKDSFSDIFFFFRGWRGGMVFLFWCATVLTKLQTDRSRARRALAVLTMITGGCWCDLCLMGRSSKLQPGTMRMGGGCSHIDSLDPLSPNLHEKPTKKGKNINKIWKLDYQTIKWRELFRCYVQEQLPWLIDLICAFTAGQSVGC